MTFCCVSTVSYGCIGRPSVALPYRDLYSIGDLASYSQDMTDCLRDKLD